MRVCSACSVFAAQAVQHREAAQLLADQGLTGCLLAMAAWMVAPDGGGAPAFLNLHINLPDSIHKCTCNIVLLPQICTPLHVLLFLQGTPHPSMPVHEASQGFRGPGILDRGYTRGRTADHLNVWYMMDL